MGEVNIVLCVLHGFLTFVAAALAIAAEATKIKASDIFVTGFGCEYPSSPASILGYTAALLLFVALTVNPQYELYDGPIFFIITSWVASIMGTGILIGAATRQLLILRRSTRLCYFVLPGLFASGGGLALVACISGLCTYIASIIKQRREQVPAAAGGIAMGNPQ